MDSGIIVKLFIWGAFVSTLITLIQHLFQSFFQNFSGQQEQFKEIRGSASGLGREKQDQRNSGAIWLKWNNQARNS